MVLIKDNNFTIDSRSFLINLWDIIEEHMIILKSLLLLKEITIQQVVY